MANVIYKIINIQNQKFYVGSAVDFDRRASRHKNLLNRAKHHCAHLQAAWNKYGAAAFVFAVIEEVPDSVNLLAAENRWLHAHAGQPYCYNTARDATAPMRNPSAETRAKMRAGMLGRFAGDKHYRFGQTVSDEVRQKIGDTQRGKSKAPNRQLTEAGKAKIRAAADAGHYASFKGKHHTEETKKLMGAAIIMLPSGKRFDTITEMRAATGMGIALVQRSLKTDKAISKGPFAGVSFQYQDPEREAARLQRAAELTATRPKAKIGRPTGSGNESQMRVVRELPSGREFLGINEYARQTGTPRSAVYKMLAGKVRDGLTLVYV